jgi:hypothetical protein
MLCVVCAQCFPSLTTSHSLIKDNVPELDAIDLQHIRRFAKARFLPTHLIPDTVAVSRSRSGSEHHADGSSWLLSLTLIAQQTPG